MCFSDSVTYIFPPAAQYDMERLSIGERRVNGSMETYSVHRDEQSASSVTTTPTHEYFEFMRRHYIWEVRSEAIPERRHNSGVGCGQNSFYCVAILRRSKDGWRVLIQHS